MFLEDFKERLSDLEQEGSSILHPEFFTPIRTESLREFTSKVTNLIGEIQGSDTLDALEKYELIKGIESIIDYYNIKNARVKKSLRNIYHRITNIKACLLYTSPSPRDA